MKEDIDTGPTGIEFGESKFGPLLKKLRRERNLTQDELATKAEIFRRASISDYENGKSLPEHATVLKIASALELDDRETDYLLDCAGHINLSAVVINPESEPELTDVAKLMSSVPEGTREEIREELRKIVAEFSGATAVRSVVSPPRRKAN